MSLDKNYCMSSYLAFRYIEDDEKDFYEGMHHSNIVPASERIYVRTAQDIDRAIGMQMTEIRGGGETWHLPCRRDGFCDSGVVYARMRRLYLPLFRRGLSKGRVGPCGVLC